MATPV